MVRSKLGTATAATATAEQAIGLDLAELRARFDGCVRGTVGIEEEVLLVHPRSFRPLPEAADLVARANDPRIKVELPSWQFELATDPAGGPAEAIVELAELRRRAAELCGDDLAPIAAAVHPTVVDPEAPTSQTDHHRALFDRYGTVVAQQVVGALQVHVAVGDADLALQVYNRLRSYLPELAALAASAPFSKGRDTGLASVRPLISGQLPRQGVPPHIESWESFVDDLRWGAATGSVPDAGWWWWELRPHLTHGTLEVRVPDVQASLAAAEGLVAAVHALVSHLMTAAEDGRPLPSAPTWRIEENRWRALRSGVRGELCDLVDGTTTPTRRVLHRLLDEVEPHSEHGLDATRSLLDANGADELRRVGVEHSVPWLVEQFVAPGRGFDRPAGGEVVRP